MVQKLSVPLAKAGITVAYISTSVLVLVLGSAPVCILTGRLAPASSYLTDFVLIERSNLVKAVSTLRRQAEVHLECTPGCGWATDVEAAWLADAVFARLRDTAAQPASPVRREVAPSCGDSGACGGNGPSSPVAPSAARSASSPRTPTPTGGVGGAAAGCHSPRSPRTASSRKHPLVFLPMRLRIAKLEKHAVKSHMHLLVKLLLLQPHGSTPRLVSFTETEDEVGCCMVLGAWCLVLARGTHTNASRTSRSRRVQVSLILPDSVEFEDLASHTDLVRHVVALLVVFTRR